MRTNCAQRPATATRTSAPDFGQAGLRRKSEGRGVESNRRFLKSRLQGRFGEIADAVPCTVLRIYGELEGRQYLTAAVLAAGLSLVTPDALASLPAPAVLRETLPAAHHMSVQATDLLLAVALAERDGVWDASEARDIEERVGRLGRTAASIALTARVAAGLALAGEVAR